MFLVNGKRTFCLRVFLLEGFTAFGRTGSICVSSLRMCLTLSGDESSSTFVSVGVGFLMGPCGSEEVVAVEDQAIGGGLRVDVIFYWVKIIAPRVDVLHL